MIYIHIPFCKQKCNYCNFHFSTSLTLKEKMISSIKKELFLRKDELENKNLSSLYFGGGTPSILSVDEIKSFIDEVSKYFCLNNDVEITLEANPDNLSTSFLKELSSSPVNRISIGVQSFFDEDLQFMNRSHNALQSENCVKKAQDFGFENLSIDLIYGYSSMDIWRKNLEKSINLDIPHISSYALTVEPKTKLSYLMRKGKIETLDEEKLYEQFHFMSEFLEKNDFEHYEISNFSKSNNHSKHNTAYWQGNPYLGLGPSAHSYDGKNKRSWNIYNNFLYVKKVNAGQIFQENEFLSKKERFNELIMTGLRTIWGINLKEIESSFDHEFMQILKNNIEHKLQNETLEIVDNHLKINKKYLFLADGIASDLFLS